jgi:hypothetical protein
MAECEPADEYGKAGQQTIEEIECTNRSDADEKEERSFHAKVSEGLVQALVDSVLSPIVGVCLHHRPSRSWNLILVLCSDLEISENGFDQIPQSQFRTFTASTAMPLPAATPASVFFAPGSPWANS